MPTTPKHALPYPAPSATPDVPYDMQQLAEKVEAKMLGQTSGVGKRVHVALGLNGSTDANGYVTLTHGAGFTPRLVQIINTSGGSSLGIPVSTDSYGATTFRARFANYTGDAVLVSSSIGTVGAVCWE